MFNDNPEAKWNREFDEMGVERVRNSAMSPSWDREKRSSARRWLERQDTKKWQERNKDVPADKVNWKQRLRGSKSWIYVGGAILLLMGAARIFRLY